MKITIVGGGSTYTPELIDGLIQKEKELNLREVVLMDIDDGREKLGILTDFSQRLIKKSGSAIKVSSTLSPREAFRETDFVINQFRAGGLEGRIRDEKIPLKYGLIGQETTGIGGMSNGIRALAVIKEYTAIIREVGNDPWIINFANPSGMLTEYLINHLEYKKTVGLCNVPIEFVLKTKEIFECSQEDIFLKYYGLNHLSWVEDIIVKGENRSKEFWDNFKLNMKNIPDVEYGEDFLPMVQFLLNPYMKYFYNTAEMIRSEEEDLASEGTRGEQIVDIEKKLLSQYAEPDREETPEELSMRGGFMYSTVATELIRDLYTGAGTTHIVNTANRGALKDLPDDYIVEIPAVITTEGPVPADLGYTNPVTTGLIHTVKNYERLTIKGFMTGEERFIKQAMLIHPLGPDEKILNELWEELKKENGAYYPAFH